MIQNHPTPGTVADAPAADTAAILDRHPAAAYLGCSVQFLDKETKAGRIRAIRLGRRVRFRVSDLEAYLDACASGGEAR